MTSSSNPFANGTPTINDDFDMNDFVNFDQGFHNSPSPTSVKMEPHSALDPRELMLQHSSHPRPQYNGPSHNYDQFRQQTGLPTGAISHVHAVNQFSNSNHVKPTNFGAAHFAGYNTGVDVGLECQTPIDGQSFFIPSDGNDDFAVDPSAIAPDSQPSSAFRAWPGMHSQQAKQQAQTQTDIKQERLNEAGRSQQALPSNFEQTFGARSSSDTNASEQQANEQISRLLNQMRQNSNASLDDDEDGTGNAANGSSGRSRKEEDDMDEDERLLASEEGKKLTSKERRQLRNKVSARAFRSRRKEYITQLEGEVAAKNNECNDMKQTNRHLLEQNRQLTQLCKAMLSHPSFNNFMEDMSNDPSILQAFAPQSQQQSTTSSQSNQQQQPPASKEEPPTPQSAQPPQQQQNIHVGMAMMPETNLDLSMLNLGANHWTYQQPQIFALYEVPSGPSIEELSASALSRKPNSEVEMDDAEAKIAVPTIKELPTLPEPVAEHLAQSTEKYVDDVKDDPNFALYVDAPSATQLGEPDFSTVVSRLEHSISEKPATYFQLHVRSQQDEVEATRAVDRIFARAAPVLRRMEAATRHLDL